MKGTRVYFYVHSITKLVLSFQNALVFNFINNKNNFLIKKSGNRPTSKDLSNSICKWFFVKMSILPRIYDQHCRKNPFMTWKLLNFSNGSQIWFKLCEMTCEITTVNFMKIKNHSNHFWSIFSFFNMLWHVFFHANLLQATII
jgi:hypothetical protein